MAQLLGLVVVFHLNRLKLKVTGASRVNSTLPRERPSLFVGGKCFFLALVLLYLGSFRVLLAVYCDLLRNCYPNFLSADFARRAWFLPQSKAPEYEFPQGIGPTQESNSSPDRLACLGSCKVRKSKSRFAFIVV